MKYLKIIFSIYFLFTFFSCTITRFLTINNSKRYFVQTQCGQISVASYYSSLNYYALVIVNQGNEEVSLIRDSLKMRILSEEVEFEETRFKLLKDTEIEDKVISLKKDELIKIIFNFKMKKEVITTNSTIPFVLEVLPTNYLTCNGESIINDTLKIDINWKTRKQIRK